VERESRGGGDEDDGEEEEDIYWRYHRGFIVMICDGGYRVRLGLGLGQVRLGLGEISMSSDDLGW
jgi:hypothetical protein